MIEHIRAVIDACRSNAETSFEVRLTDFDGDFGAVVDRIVGEVGEVGDADVDVHHWPERPNGRGYYPSLCFKVGIRMGDVVVEVADGGLTDWTKTLVASDKERSMISGLSIERLAML